MRALGALAASGVVAIASFLLAVAVARQTSIEEFGEFSLVALLYLFVTSGIRASITDTALAQRGDEGAVRRAVERSALVSLIAGFALFCVGLVFTSAYALALALALPLMCALDLVRTIEAGVGRASVSLALSAAWSAPSLSVSALALLLPIPPIVIFATWLGAGACAGAAALLWRRLPWFPRWRSAPRETRAAAVFFADYVVGSGGAMGTTALLGGFAGPGVIAAIRGAGTLLGPAALVANTSRSLIIPALATSATAATPVGRAIRIGLAMSAVALPLFILLAFLPDAWGRALLGASWTVAATVMLPMATEAYLAMISSIPAAGHRAQLAGRRTIALRLIVGVPRPFAVIGAALIGGAEAAAWAMAVLALVNVLLWWGSYLRLSRRADGA